MPTGYTADIEKGITFKQFIMSCSRAFGALVTMRDDPHNAEIPERFEPSNYHKIETEKAEKELCKLQKMSIKTANTNAIAEYKQQVIYLKERITEIDILKSKYQAMLLKVKEWQPPSPDHIDLKKFMIEQIEDSIKFDCNTDYYYKEADKLITLTPSEWKNKKIAQCLKDIEYHKKIYAEEVERVENRNLWLKQLRESL